MSSICFLFISIYFFQADRFMLRREIERRFPAEINFQAEIEINAPLSID